jgi:ADP-heptose:LPS heptosyltransferase
MVVGGPEEAAANAALLETVHDAGVIDGGCGHSLQDFGAVLTMGSVVVTSDSLALHVATALGVRAVVLVGPTSPWELELFGRGEVIHAGVPCLACYHRRCPLPVTCMDLLRPDEVLAAVERQIAQRATARRSATRAPDAERVAFVRTHAALRR